MRIDLPHGIALEIQMTGPQDGPAVVFAHALGLSHAAWAKVIAALPAGLRCVAWDMRGHGTSDVPDGPYAMGTLVKDMEALCEALNIRDAVIVGNSIGGMIAQGLAAKRLDIVRALVLANTAPKIGTRAMWESRIDAIRSGGIAPMADDILARWFARQFRESDAAIPWREALLACPAEGYAGCAAAIAGTDFYSTTGALRLPTLVVAGSEDGSTPPDLVKELADLIPGSDYRLMRGTGHVPPADSPAAFADLLTEFLARIGHVTP